MVGAAGEACKLERELTLSGMDMPLEYSGEVSKKSLHLALPPASMRLI